jgi:hypothetical protein
MPPATLGPMNLHERFLSRSAPLELDEYPSLKQNTCFFQYTFVQRHF